MPLESLVSRTDDLLRLATTKLHAFPYRDVPLCWRRLYTDASILKAVAQIGILLGSSSIQSGESTIDLEEKDAEIVKTLDMALIMTGAPGDDRREIFDELLEELDRYVSGINATRERLSGKRRKLHLESLIPPHPLSSAPGIQFPIDRLDEPLSLEQFQLHLNGANTPMIISKLISHWPALTDHPWSSASYLLSKTHQGKRLVPVELGKSYTTADWGQKIMTFKEFINNHILNPRSKPRLQAEGEAGEISVEDEPMPSPTGYLAQHTLFSQIPSLRNDILIPDYCYTSPPPPPSIVRPAQLDDPLVNAWFGPSGTISPLHTDPYSNILTQVLGRKYIRLYAPSETSNLFPRGVDESGVDMSNTSQVDIDDNDLAGLGDQDRYEKWRGAQYVEGVLDAGEGLYIPVCSNCPKLEASFFSLFFFFFQRIYECACRVADGVDVNRLGGGIISGVLIRALVLVFGGTEEYIWLPSWAPNLHSIRKRARIATLSSSKKGVSTGVLNPMDRNCRLLRFMEEPEGGEARQRDSEKDQRRDVEDLNHGT